MARGAGLDESADSIAKGGVPGPGPSIKPAQFQPSKAKDRIFDR